MRTVLLGSDFMYDKDGNLKPIEINEILAMAAKAEPNMITLFKELMKTL